MDQPRWGRILGSGRLHRSNKPARMAPLEIRLDHANTTGRLYAFGAGDGRRRTVSASRSQSQLRQLCDRSPSTNRGVCYRAWNRARLTRPPKSHCRNAPGSIKKPAGGFFAVSGAHPFPFFVSRLHGDAMIVIRDRMRLIWQGSRGGRGNDRSLQGEPGLPVVATLHYLA
jgi:hypothetical protein